MPLSLVSVGIVYNDSCPALSNLPQLLIALGTLITISSAVNTIDYNFGHLAFSKVCRSIFMIFFNVIINGLAIVAFAFICVQIFRKQNDPDFADAMSIDYCHPFVYLFSYWLATSVLGFLWMLLLFSAVFWCVSVTSKS